MKNKITLQNLKKIFQQKGYKWDTTLNLIGIRTLDQTTDVFNDYVCLVYKENLVGVYECTTDPGLYFLQKPMNVNGTAILPEGQHLSIWTKGLHKNYKALVQCRKISVYRDRDKNSTLDYNGGLHTDAAGINFHRGHETWTRKALSYLKEKVFKTIKVGQYSAGCQVVAYKDDFDAIMSFIDLSGKLLFDYTLLNEKDFEQFNQLA